MRALAIVAILFGTLTAANAADMELKAPSAPVSNWTGFYIGGFAGGSRVDGSYFSFNGGNQTFNASGFVGGVYVGYDYELPNRFVVGARISAPFGAISQSAVVFPSGNTIKSEFQWASAANLTFGYDMGQWMPYVGAGVIFADNKATLTNPGGTASDTELHPGLNVLAGVKYAVTRNWALGVQYNYSEFAQETYYFAPPVSADAPGKFSQNSVVGLVEYRF